MAAILLGAESFTDLDYFQASAGGGGNPLCHGGTLVWRPATTTVSATRVLLSTLIAGNTGWRIRTAGANATADMTFADGGGVQRSSGVAALTNLTGKLCVLSFVWDGVGSRLRIYLNRAEVGTGTAITGYTPSTGVIRLGAEMSPTVPATFNAIYGFTLWEGLATLAQIQAQHDAIMAADGRIKPVPGMNPVMTIDLTADTVANGGVLPATLEDRAGNNDMIRTGSPTSAPAYARAFGW